MYLYIFTLIKIKRSHYGGKKRHYVKLHPYFSIQISYLAQNKLINKTNSVVFKIS